MIFTIGRDAKTSQLSITAGQQLARIGQAGSVPQTVSRQHCSLTVDADGTMKLRNLKPENTTYVNGVAVEQKTIKPSDTVQLGPDRYQVDMKTLVALLDKLTPKTADIRPLKQLYSQYEHDVMQLEIAERKFNSLRGATGLITMAAILLSFTLGHGPVYMILYITAILVSAAFTVKAYRNSSNMPKRKKELQDRFKDKYRCPNCGHHYSMNYNELVMYDACPFCKAKLIK